MKPRKNHSLCQGLLLALPCFALSVDAGILVDLDATALPAGPLPSWTNTGALAGSFNATGAPAVAVVGGVNAVTFAGNGDFYTGPVAPSSITGVNPSRSIEVWAFNPSVGDEETLVAWGRRGGPDGTNMAFNYGSNGSYGALGQWGGGPDLGWNNAGGSPAAGVWHYLVYTCDGGGVAGAGTTRVYADGVLMNSEAAGNLSTHDGLPFVLGGQNNDAGTPAGFNSGLSIARVRVHDVTLSPAEIAAKYAEEVPQIYPAAYLTSAKVVSGAAVAFTIQDRPPGSVASPSTFTVSVGGIRAGWQVPGGDGIVNGSITSGAFTVPSTEPVTLTLSHRYNFEGDGTPANVWDGGVVQVSVNGGAFVTVSKEQFTLNGYFPGGPIVGTGVLRDEGAYAFNGMSAGFATGALIDSIAVLPGVTTGDSVKVRFLGAWDDAVSPDGIDWEIAGVKVVAGADVLLDQNFTSGNGGFTAESTGGVATWNFIAGTQPALGVLQASKSGDVTTLLQPIAWAPGRSYSFTISGKSTSGAALEYTTTVNTPTLPLVSGRTWPVTTPGPMGTANAWGVRTYLNQGLNGAEDLTAVLDFLAGAADRTPVLTPDTVVDTAEAYLNFRDPESNPATNGVIPNDLPFPGDALSTATNGGTARGDDHVITSAHGTIQIAAEGDYTFNIHCDDGFMFRIRAASGPHPKFIATGGPGSVDQTQQNLLFFPAGTGDADTRGIVHLTPGSYKLEYVTWEGGGGFFYEVSVAHGFFPANADTSTWTPVGISSNRTTPIQYPSMVGQWTVDSTTAGVQVGSNEAASASVDAAIAADPVATRSLWDSINFQDDGGGGSSERIGGSDIFPRIAVGAADDNFALRAQGTLHIPEEGDYLIGFQGDDGSKLTIGGTNPGFSALVENATGASVIGRKNTIAVNSGSLGAAVNLSPDTSAVFEEPGALAGSTDKAVSVLAADAQTLRAPYNAALNPETAFTVEAWVKPAVENNPGALTCVLSSGKFSDPRSGWLIYQDQNAWNVRLYNKNGLNFTQSLVASNPIVAGTWYHIAASWDPADPAGPMIKFFLNGELMNFAVVDPLVSNPIYVPSDGGTLNIGSRADGAFKWSGSIDEVAVYGAALTEAELTAHYLNGMDAARTTPYQTLILAGAPLAYWRLNESIQPRVELNTLNYDAALSGDSSTVGRIRLAAGDYPITALFWEAGGGASFEVFAAPDLGVPFQLLKKDGVPSLEPHPGLPLVTTPTPPQPQYTGPGGGLTVNPDRTLNLSFTTQPYSLYITQQSPDLLNWQDVGLPFEATGTTKTITGETGSYLYIDAELKKFFYRVKALP